MAVTGKVKFTGLRGIIAQKMSESLNKTAQLSFFASIDASALVSARDAWKAREVKLGYEDLIAKSVSLVVGEFPAFNGIETSEGVELHDEVHVGCAIAVPGGLVAPAIANVETLPLPKIAEIRQDLIARAKINKLTIGELTGATFTLTNLGLTRVEHFTPILTYPQQAILGLGRIVRRPWVDADGHTLAVRSVMGLSLTVDHRTIDGAPAGDFLTALAEALEAAKGLLPDD